MANLHDCIDRGISSGLLKEQTGLDLQHKIEGFTRELTLNGKMDIKQVDGHWQRKERFKLKLKKSR